MPTNLAGLIVKGLLTTGLLLIALSGFDARMPLASGVPLALAALFAWFTWRDWQAWRYPPSSPATGPGLERTFVYCAFFLAADTVLLGAPMLGTYAALVLVFWLAPRALLARNKQALWRHRASVILITVATLAIDLCAFWLYETVAQARVIEVAQALDRHKAAKGAYPAQLEALVPGFLSAVPPAKPGFVTMNGIWYVHHPTGPTALMYVSFPPFGRKVYDVETRAWTDLD